MLSLKPKADECKVYSPLSKSIEYGVYGHLLIIYPKAIFYLLKGTVRLRLGNWKLTLGGSASYLNTALNL